MLNGPYGSDSMWLCITTELGRTLYSRKDLRAFQWELLQNPIQPTHPYLSSPLHFFTRSAYWYFLVLAIRHIDIPRIRHHLVLIVLPRLGLNSYLLVTRNKLHINHVLEVPIDCHRLSLHCYRSQVDRLSLTSKAAPNLSPQHHLSTKCKQS